mgnify:CR=1 FL=1
MFGIRTHKVKILSKIVKKTGAKVVISSSWRGGWFQPYEKKSDRQKELQDKLEKAYEFMKQFVINGRNMLDVFRERIGEVKEWVHRKVAGMGR